MKHFFKLVALTLLMTIGAVPLLAGVSFPEQSASGMHCPPGCPMMAKAAQTRVVEEMKVLPPCCTVSHSKSEPVVPLQAPNTTAIVAVPEVEVVGASLVSHDVERDLDLPLPDTVSAQSLLCTFLI